MKRNAEFSKSFYFILFIIAVVTLIIGFSFLPSHNYKTFIGTGDSMEPTLSDGDELLVDPKAIPELGDIVVFSCFSCDGISPEEILTKRLIEIDQQGCYWLTGDNKKNSFDSRDTRWLCEDDLEVFGVVVGINS